MLAQALQLQQESFELAGWPVGWRIFLLLFGVLAGGYLVFWFYRRETRVGASRGVRVVLGVLRCAALALLVAIALEPILAVYRTQTKPGRVVLLWDASGSMTVRDQDQDGDSADATRLARVRAALGEDGAALLRQLAEKNALNVVAFGAQMRPLGLPWEGDPAGASQPALPGEMPELTAETDLGGAVLRVLDELGDDPIAGVVVVSDGVANAGPPAEAIITAARSRKAPLYTIGVGAREEPPNLRVVEFAGPETAPLGDPFELRAEIAASGSERIAGSVTLRAERVEAGGPTEAALLRVVEERSVTFTPGAALQSLRFQINPDRAGEYVYRLEVRGDVIEANAADNIRTAVVQVIDAKYRVLLVAGRPSYEYRFLLSLLERDASMNVSAWLQSADERAVRDGNTVITELPRTPEALFAYDVVVLLDPYPDDFDSAFAIALKRFVDEFNGGLLFCAGSQFSGRLLRDTRLAELVAVLPILPDADADIRLAEAGTYRTSAVRFALDPAVRAHPVLTLSDDPAVTQQLWEGLPGFWWWLPVAREKPLATVLLRHAAARSVESDQNLPLLAVQPLGGGWTGYLGVDATWRWRATAEGVYNRFWLQLVRYLGQGRRESADRRGTLVLDRETVHRGDYVKIDARVLDAQYAPWFEPNVMLKLDLPTGAVQDVALAAIPDRPGWFGARVLFDQPGATILRLPLPPAGDGAAREVRKIVRVQQPDVEWRTLARNEALLQELAAETDGLYLDLSEIDKLPNAIADARHTTVTRDPQAAALWNEPWVLLVIAGLLAIEWTIRRRNYLL